jgi:hypothetical protein
MLSLVVLASAVLANVCLEKNAERLKEWRDLTDVEKKGYVDAVRCLADATKAKKRLQMKLPFDLKSQTESVSRHDDFSLVRLRSRVITDMLVSLPWHRVFLRLYDHALRKDCGYTGAIPYWDLSIDGFKTPSIWQYFNNLQITSSIPVQHPVIRGRMPAGIERLFSADRVRKALSIPNYNDFRVWLENTLLAALQKINGGANLLHLLLKTKGDLQLMETAANDPLFYLIRRYADRLWYLWQKTQTKGFFLYRTPGKTAHEFQPMFFYGLSTVTFDPNARDVVGERYSDDDDISVDAGLNPLSGRVNGLMCYVYEDPKTQTTQRWNPVANSMNWRPLRRQ